MKIKTQDGWFRKKEIDISVEEISDLFDFNKKIEKWEKGSNMDDMPAAKWDLFIKVKGFLSSIWNSL